ncbi:hypothetical protein Bbelb_382070 [Branchiostoma belcheri]|nr:hypothetical protein Bbelb_382070 [Branchiostoma belcheri]
MTVKTPVQSGLAYNQKTAQDKPKGPPRSLPAEAIKVLGGPEVSASQSYSRQYIDYRSSTTQDLNPYFTKISHLAPKFPRFPVYHVPKRSPLAFNWSCRKRQMLGPLKFWVNTSQKYTGNNNVLYVTLVIVVTDVPGYPPFYNKRCETPVLPHKDRDGDYVYTVIKKLNEIWSTSSYWIRCGADLTFDVGPVLAEWTFQYNVTGCPEGWYGLYCDKNCVCKNRARCHGFNGACECRPGWSGRACDIPWPEVAIVETPGDSVVKYIGTNLTLTCLAPHILVANMTWAYQTGKSSNVTKFIEERAVQNSSISFQPIQESANGKYSCMVQAEDGQIFNATFILNATECRPNYYGEVCSQVCDCEYGGTCDRWAGCLCPAGRRGDRCEHECAPGTFGRNCSGMCYCENNALCDPVNGSCICAEGQPGEFCHECLHGTFGRNCSMYEGP